MTYGTVVVNNAGSLAITDSSTNYHYMGSYNAYTTFAGTDGFARNGLLRFAYYSVSAQNKPIIFAEPSGTNNFALYAVTNTGANAYRVLFVYQGTPPRIHAFSTLNTSSPAENYGFAIYRADGTLAFDSSRQPLAVHAITTFAGSASPLSVPGLSNASPNLNNAGINLGAIPARAAFFYQQYGATFRVYENGTRSDGNHYFSPYAALTYRNGNTFNRIWTRASVAGFIASTATPWNYDDTTAHPLFVIDAARYD